MPRPMSYPACQQFDLYESINRRTITTPPSSSRRGVWTFSMYASWSARRERRRLTATKKRRRRGRKLLNKPFKLQSAVVPKNKSDYNFLPWIQVLSVSFFLRIPLFRHKVFWSYATARVGILFITYYHWSKLYISPWKGPTQPNMPFMGALTEQRQHTYILLWNLVNNFSHRLDSLIVKNQENILARGHFTWATKCQKFNNLFLSSILSDVPLE